jgi:hypothetical protein
MSDINQTAKLVCYAFLNMMSKEDITDDVILKTISEKIASAPEFKDVDLRNLFEVIRSECGIGKGEITIMSDDIDPWLSEEKSNINFELWSRYKLYMSQNDPSFPINDLDDFTDKILDKCVNPKDKNSWDRRGMVVGHVQSGKTSNYVGLINKGN